MQIDWSTLAIQTVNVLILVWILARFFFRPVSAIVAKRQAEAKKLLDDARSQREAADEARAQAQKALAGVDAERERLMGEARSAADAAKAEMLDKAQAEAAKRRKDAEAEIARERASADQAILAHAGALSVDIARRLVGRLPAASVQAAFVDALIQSLEGEAAGHGPADGQGEDVEIVSAAPLTKAQAERIRSGVAKAFGEATPCRFRTDADIVAGVELHGRNVIILNSWRADLDAMGKELSRDGRPSEA